MTFDMITVNVVLIFATLSVLLLELPVRRYLGALSAYLLWLIVPMSVVVSLLPQWWIGSQITDSLQVTFRSQQVTQLVGEIGEQHFFWALYAIGGVSVLAYLIVSSLVMVKRAELRGPDSSEIALLNLLNEQQRQKGIGIQVSQSNHGPYTFGLRQPVIVLPQDFVSRFDCHQQHLIIAHELTHIRRLDNISNVLATLFAAVFWFNPLSWIALRHFRQAQELSCDQAVLASQPIKRRIDYAKAMLSCVAQGQKLHLFSNPYGANSKMKIRIEAVKKHRRTSKLQHWGIAAILVVMTSITASVAATIHAPEANYLLSPIKRVEPVYPAFAAKNSIEGKVIVEFDVMLNGALSNISIVDSQPEGVFDEATISAVSQWVYQRPNNQISDVKVQLDYVLSDEAKQFSLQNASTDKELILIAQ